ncbi:hypothetical protein TNIN_155031, partial [Trichonephila inaurata madagascariensis]
KDNHSWSHLRLHLCVNTRFSSSSFPGELTDWLRFHNQFKENPAEDKSIDDGDKFQYLIQAATPKIRARDIWEISQLIPGKMDTLESLESKLRRELVSAKTLQSRTAGEPEISLPKDLTDSVIRTREAESNYPKRLTYA